MALVRLDLTAQINSTGKTFMNSTTADAPAENVRSQGGGAHRYNTVMLIPVLGGNGKIQNRTLLFARPPTKEFAIETVNRLHKENSQKDNYSNEWSRCAEIFKQVPEELFAQMNQRRTTSITHLVDVSTRDGIVQRMFSSRSCFVHEIPVSPNHS